jgi:hypothetical protein
LIVGQVWSIINMRANWRLLWINMCIFTVDFCITGIIMKKVNNIIVVQVINRYKWNTVILNRKLYIWQSIGWYIYYPIFIVPSEVSNVDTIVDVHHQASMTLIMTIYIWLTTRNAATILSSKLMVILLPIHTQNLNQSRSHIQISQTLR